MIMKVEPLWGLVWTPTENDVFQYQEIVAPSTRALEIENFQLQKKTKDLVESPEKAASETNNNDNSSTMNLCGEHDSCQTILIMPTFTVDSKHVNQICTFCRGRTHVVENHPYKSSQISIFVTNPIFGTTQPTISVNS